MKPFLARITGHAIVLFVRLMTAFRAIWDGVEPRDVQRVYFANHSSNGDMPMIWSALPPVLRDRTRPIAAADYWLTSPLRAFFGRDVFNAVLIDRRPEARDEDPMAQILAAIDDGASLIIFPEGKRNMGEEALLPFKSGIYNISKQRPGIELVPVWIENLNRVMPKGTVIPIPLICTLTFGAPIHVAEDEDRQVFLDRARDALLALRPREAAA